MLRLATATWILLLFATEIARAQTAQIDVYSSNPPPGAYNSIQSGIDAAITTGATVVMVHDGTYQEWINFKGFTGTVVSANGAAATIIDGSVVSPQRTVVVRFVTGEGPSSTLDGFTVIGGQSGTGGGIRCIGSSPTIRNCVITNNTGFPQSGGTGFGGGVYIENGAPLLEQCEITGNQSNFGGGIYSTASSPIVRTNSISGNTATSATGAGGEGGGTYLVGNFGTTATVIFGNSISTNTADDDGGGIYVQGPMTLTVDGNLLAKNQSKTPNTINGGGGGIAFRATGASLITVVNNNFSSNAAEFAGGGGILLDGSHVFIDHNTFSNNFADTYGGAIDCISANPTIQSNTLSSSNTGWLGGGGIASREGSAGLIATNLISGNLTPNLGAGIYVDDSGPRIIRNDFRSNGRSGLVSILGNPPTLVSATLSGGGIAVKTSINGMSPNITTNQILENFAVYEGAGAWLDGAGGQLRLNLVKDNGVITNAAGNLQVTAKGGGIYANRTTTNFDRNRILSNHAQGGAGIWIAGPTQPILTNSFIARNWARTPATQTTAAFPGTGAGVYLESSSPLFENNTMTANSTADSTTPPIALGSGGALYADVNSIAAVTTSIAWQNVALNEYDTPQPNAVLVQFSLIGPSLTTGNWITTTPIIQSDPLFVNPATDNYHLLPGSPCIDFVSLTPQNLFDIDGQPRVMGIGLDIGADEF